MFFFCEWLYLKNLENTQITKSLPVMLRKEIADSAASVCFSDNLPLFINYVLYENSEAAGNNNGD